MHCIYWPEINTTAVFPVLGNPLLTRRMDNENLNRYDSQFNETTKIFNLYGIKEVHKYCAQNLSFTVKAFSFRKTLVISIGHIFLDKLLRSKQTQNVVKVK